MFGSPSGAPDPFLQICFPEYQASKYTGAFDGSSPGVGVYTSLCSIAELFCQMTVLNQLQTSRQAMKLEDGLACSEACYLFPTILQIE